MGKRDHLIGIQILCLRNLPKYCALIFSCTWGCRYLCQWSRKKVQNQGKMKGCEIMVTKLGWEVELTEKLSNILIYKDSRPFIFISMMRMGHWYFLEILRWRLTCYSDSGTVLSGFWVEGSSSHSRMCAQLWHAHSGVTHRPHQSWPQR